jgi:hypothetical protein
MIRLYCDPETSEVTEEYPSLHAALADMRQPPPEASLVDNGMTLALEYRDRWSLTSHGVRVLAKEYATKEGT